MSIKTIQKHYANENNQLSNSTKENIKNTIIIINNNVHLLDHTGKNDKCEDCVCIFENKVHFLKYKKQYLTYKQEMFANKLYSLMNRLSKKGPNSAKIVLRVICPF